MSRRRRRPTTKPENLFLSRLPRAARPPASADAPTEGDVLGQAPTEGTSPAESGLSPRIEQLTRERYGFVRATVSRRAEDDAGGVVPWDYTPAGHGRGTRT